MKHKGTDYKVSAVQYYKKHKKSLSQTCKIFNCSKGSLHRWVQRYENGKNITRKNRKYVSYKIRKEQVKEQDTNISQNKDTKNLFTNKEN